MKWEEMGGNGTESSEKANLYLNAFFAKDLIHLCAEAIARPTLVFRIVVHIGAIADLLVLNDNQSRT
jgi:hypothetical protein